MNFQQRDVKRKHRKFFQKNKNEMDKKHSVNENGGKQEIATVSTNPLWKVRGRFHLKIGQQWHDC